MAIKLNPNRPSGVQVARALAVSWGLTAVISGASLFAMAANAQTSPVRTESRSEPGTDNVSAPQSGDASMGHDRRDGNGYEHGRRHSMMERKLRRLDTDRDGAISRTELEAKHQRHVALFEQADADRDGKVTVDELRAFRARHRKERHSEQRNDSGPASGTQ